MTRRYSQELGLGRVGPGTLQLWPSQFVPVPLKVSLLLVTQDPCFLGSWGEGLRPLTKPQVFAFHFLNRFLGNLV